MAGDICVDVVKYSHATGVRPDNSIPWTHLTGSGIFVLLRRKDSGVDDELMLQVVQGTTVLESVHVSSLIDSAIAARQGSQQAGIAPQVEQLPIFGITKDVLLALRYRVADGQARRIQFRMQSAADCCRVVEILQRRGMEFQQQRPRTARPDTAGSNLRPMTTTSNFSSTTSRLPADPLRPSPFQSQTLEAGSLSGGIGRTSSRPQTVQSSYPNVMSPSREMAPPSVPSFNRHHSIDTAGPEQPTSQAFRPFTTPNLDTHGTMRPPAPVAPDASSDASGFSFRRPPAITSYEKPTFQPPSDVMGTVSWPSDSAAPEPMHATNNLENVSRPTTARSGIAAGFTMPMTLEHEIPPPRKLPFERSGSSRPSTAASATSVKQSHLKETSKALGIPKQPSPKKAPASSRPSTASPLKRSIAAVERENERPQTALAPASRRPSPAKPAQASAANESIMRRPSNAGEMLRTMVPLTERSPNANANRSPTTAASKTLRMKSLADADYELETPPHTSSSSHRRSRNERNMSSSPTRRHVGERERDTTLVPYNALRDSGQTSSLARYAAQSRADRLAELDEFMIAKLEDEPFVVLTEDVDACWRRMQLGL